VAAGRLAENPDVSVLLLQAGGSDDAPEVTETLACRPTASATRDGMKGSGDDMPQDYGEQAPCNGYLDQLEADITAVAHTLAPILIKPPDPRRSA
jgi:choline dehydrogenase-like flavoprotein